MPIRVKGKGMKFIMSSKKFGAVVVDGDGLELSFTPEAIRRLAEYFSECVNISQQGKPWR
jgi:hypothetical protein